MKPDYHRAAQSALETLKRYNVNDPFVILNDMRNVLLISYGAENDDSPVCLNGQDAVTLVNRKNGELQYIVLYNHFLSETMLRSTLAKALAHVILEHDGTSPEEVWSEEANCFAYHFLCPLTRKIHFRPLRKCLSAEVKALETYDSIEALKCAVAEKRTRYCHFIGKNVYFAPSEVKFVRSTDRLWENCYDVVVDGITVGHCGE